MFEHEHPWASHEHPYQDMSILQTRHSRRSMTDSLVTQMIDACGFPYRGAKSTKQLPEPLRIPPFMLPFDYQMDSRLLYREIRLLELTKHAALKFGQIWHRVRSKSSGFPPAYRYLCGIFTDPPSLREWILYARDITKWTNQKTVSQRRVVHAVIPCPTHTMAKHF